ncbi:MAG: Neutral/alkaline non-lysosomal ceramidase [Gemmataceae bacterium]|nr:Neutral/alkaline non-lysosomal ceramidase [Gemmataceae bacterium]
MARLILLSLALFLPPTSRAGAAELSVGFAEVDVTPELGKKPVFLAGFGQDRRATKVHDPITARAVVLGDGTDRIALVSVDVVGLFNTSVERVRKNLPGFKYVLVSATHNHEGPDTLGLWGASPIQSGVDPDYLKKVEDGCVAAARAADAARKPAVARIGTASDPDLIRDTRLPVVKHDELVAVQFRDPKTDAVLGILVQWNCHPEVLDSKNTEITADFVHYTVKHLRAVQKCPVAYFTGTVGGLMTTIRLPVKDEDGKDLRDGTFEKAERYGRLVGMLGEKAIATATPVTLTPFDVRTQEILLPIDNNIYRLAWQFGTLSRPAYVWDGNPTPKQFAPTKDIAKPIAVKTEVGYLKLGDLEVAVIPGEIYPELVLGKVQDPADPGADFPDAPAEPAVYAQLKGKHRMLIGLGNDELGYIIPKRQWDEKPPFCYGLKKPQYGEMNSLGPETAPILCRVFRDLVSRK